MKIHFYLRYHTHFGQTIFITGNTGALGNDNRAEAFALSYLDNEFWYGSIEMPDKKALKEINYRYILREEGEVDILDADADRVVDPTGKVTKDIGVIDTWNTEGNFENVFYTLPFQKHLLKEHYKAPKLKEPKLYTHEFKVKAPLLNANEWVCITGSGKIFDNWDVKKLLPLKATGNWYSIKINLSKEDFPIRYKYGIYNTRTKTFIFESGNDRVLHQHPVKKSTTILHDGFIHLHRTWRGSGIAIPIFSLRSTKGFGTGEFNDINLLVDWAMNTGIKMLQFLPINDTTATHTAKDSYPYSAISAFALHPLYINLDSVAGGKHASLIKALNKKKKSLELQPHLDYEGVMKFKLSILKEIFHAEKEFFLTDINYFNYFDLNREWLVPYA
ncbi:MAG: 4-alpha-glucanotransferase, partial [Chitinophagaceae bacterium]|nr:4-alpha-glucanotransferase [Chitinophagaceae bacterium]